MPSKRRHSKKSSISPKLSEVESQHKKQGVQINRNTDNRDEQIKLSQDIATLIDPYKELDGGTTQGHFTLLAIACVSWNASLINEPERGEMVKKVVSVFKDKTDEKGLLEFSQLCYELIERKLRLFPNDKRFVVKFNLPETKE